MIDTAYVLQRHNLSAIQGNDGVLADLSEGNVRCGGGASDSEEIIPLTKICHDVDTIAGFQHKDIATAIAREAIAISSAIEDIIATAS